MIHLNALDFNVCRPEEVISFFWRSVYLSSITHLQALKISMKFLLQMASDIRRTPTVKVLVL